MEISKIKNYYNEFVNYQSKSGVNERIYSLYREMCSLGLNKTSKVLELGCGIGTMSYLLSKKIKGGLLEAVDLSDQSIDFAKAKLNKKNLLFKAQDVVDYQPLASNFDFITLFDVIEHIPLERHPQLFENLSKIASSHTKILINIPNPAAIEYDAKHNPDALQIIDQPVPFNLIVELAEKNELQMTYFKTYTIWMKEDYQFFILRKKREFVQQILSKERNLFQKIIHRLKIMYLANIHRYS